MNRFGDNTLGSKHYYCLKEPLGKQSLLLNKTNINNHVHKSHAKMAQILSIRNDLLRKNLMCHHFIQATYAKAVERITVG